MSVAAVDSSDTVASFSQQNNAVEISAPGVGVLSTYLVGAGILGSMYTLNEPVKVFPFDGSAKKDSGLLELCNCGDATVKCPACSGMNCLVIRGTNAFADKVKIAEESGCKGVGIYNNVAGTFTGTLNGLVTGIPSVSMSQDEGVAASKHYGQSSQISVLASNYVYMDGTSMATPHVSGVAALVWSTMPSCKAQTIRDALNKSAKPLPTSTSVRNDAYGNGLVQAANAVAYLKTNGACA
jgi:subtilisin family serine protease